MSDRLRKLAASMLILPAMALTAVPGISRAQRFDRSFSAMNRIVQMPAPGKSRGSVSINEGEEDDLITLYGIGETLAAMIIEERETNGPFYYPEDLTSVRGIGMGKLSRIIDDLDY